MGSSFLSARGFNPDLPTSRCAAAAATTFSWHRRGEDLQAVVQIVSKEALPDALGEVTVGVLETMRGLADDYEPPSWACNSYRALMGELSAMEGDILRHVHLENHVLMRRFAQASPSTAS